MIGLRGAARYLRAPRGAGAWSCAPYGGSWTPAPTTCGLMVPFVRTVEELVAVRALIAESGLLRPRRAAVDHGRGAVQRLPRAPLRGRGRRRLDRQQRPDPAQSWAWTATAPASAERYSPLDPSVLAAIGRVIEGAHEAGVPVSVCGDAPSREPELVRALVELGIDAISVVPSAFEETRSAIDAAAAARP